MSNEDFELPDDLEVPDVELEYEQPDDEDGCEGGACKI